MAFPQTPAAKEIEITSWQPSRQSVTHSLKRQIRASGAQRFHIKATLPVMKRAQAAPIISYIESLKGQYITFDYIPPIHSQPLMPISGDIALSGNYSVGVNAVSHTGGSAALSAGDYFSFAGHAKVYMVTIATTTSTHFSPELIAPVSAGELIHYFGVKFSVAMAKDKFKYKVQPGGFYTFQSIDMVEVV